MDENVYQIPELEEDTLDDGLNVVLSKSCTVLMNLLNREDPFNTRIISLYPSQDEDSPVSYVDKDGNYITVNVVIPNMMVHLCHNSRVHKMYCEFTFDRLMLNYLRSIGIYSEFRDKACKKIYNEFKDDMGHNERIFMVRPRMYCPKEYGISDILTIGTVGHWRTMQNRREFLNDNNETELAFDQYKMKHLDKEEDFFRLMEAYVENLHSINIKLVDGTYTHNRAFEEYRNHFNLEFGDEYKKINPSTGVEETHFYNPLYDFYEKFYLIYFDDLIPDEEE